MKQEIILKKNIFGGFDRKQVIDCIEKLQQKSLTLTSSEEILGLKQTVEQYSNLLNEKSQVADRLKTHLEEIRCCNNSGINDSVINSISEANRNVENAKHKSEQITQALKNNINNKNDKLENLFRKLEDINEQSEIIKSKLNKILSELDKIEIDYSSDVSSDNVKRSNKEIYSEPIVTDIISENLSSKLTDEKIDLSFQDEENYNSIDNFFAELYKMTNGKLFEPRKLPESDTVDDFEYEY